MSPDLFTADLQAKPRVMRALADRLREGNPWDALGNRPPRVILLGMGSSAYAGSVAAARLRAQGILAVAERASTELLPQWGPGDLVIAISASGSSKETLDALDRLRPGATTVALTNTEGSDLARLCDHTILLWAEPEAGGVACRSYQHTQVLLLALEAWLIEKPLDELTRAVEAAASACEHLLATTDSWLAGVTELLDGPDGSHLAAPAGRLCSAQQGALMLREGPRRFAVPCETGDWAHVDVYLTKNTDYRLLVFCGSPWESGVHEWTQQRGTTVVSVGGEFPGAKATVRYPNDHLEDVRLLVETLVPELVAARIWDAQAC